MSTDSPDQPRTRAEMRALRAAAEAAAAEEAATRGAPDAAEEAPAPAGAPDGRSAEAEAANRAPSRDASPGPAPAGAEDGRVSAFDAAIRATSSGYEPVTEAAPEPVPAAKAADMVASQGETEPDATIPAEPADPSEPVDAPEPAVPSSPAAVHPESEKTGTWRDHRFGILLVSVLGVLALVGATLGIISLTQGPRLVSEQIDPAQAIEVSGSRLILTTNQPLTAIDPEQVSVEPAVPFTVDAAGRSVGIRFTVPLDDETTYSVRVADVASTGGGPSTDLTTTFTTPPSEVFLLKRDAEGADSIFRTDLTGEKAVPVFTAERIDDYRATTTQLVVAVEDEEGSSVLVMNRDGSEQRELELPGDGFVTGVQVSDRGGLVGYTYSDRELTESSGRASVLVTQPIDGSGEPRIVEVADAESSIAEWEFVPDSAAVLFIDWEGALALEDLSSDAGTQALGTALSIMGVSRGTYTAIIERTDGSIVELNLADGSEAPLAASEPDYGVATTIAPFPGGTLRHIVTRDAEGLPTGQAVIRVDEDGAATPILEVPSTDTILQVCPSPSGQYTAVTVAPDLADNPYDDLLAPLPQTLHTHVLDTETGEEIVPVTGFDISWCPVGPVF
ncbi:hypothetical protein OED01_00375 [Microbacterium sp. M28]|uniref:hypothetical protein n=1 Tax=Microbacterium sp. M28 TaxID=2962064 RepID=UPI0021F498EF|nr:hypothetical protein [Microbacterium sp. M28]UYO97221.1 hypothetical protein OED01_00375 [Microbacterium sp. M28]